MTSPSPSKNPSELPIKPLVPELDKPSNPELPVAPDEDTEIAPDGDPFETPPPYELPEPGEGP